MTARIPPPGDPQRQVTPAIGRQFGHYRIVGKIGRGGMGAVWKARNEVLRRTVALKLLPEDTADSPGPRRRLLREARAASCLKHDGIATLFEVGEVEGRLFIATEFVEGSTLHQILEQGALPVAEAVRIAVAVAEALGHAHEHGVIHRDVSSSNIMVGPDGRVTLIDFGLAQLGRGSSTRLTPSGAMVGTFPYVAPELIRREEPGPRSDLYALGVVLFEMLTGRPPFEGPVVEAILHSTLNQPPDPPSRLRPDVSDAIDRVVLKALAKEPHGRYPTAAMMIQDLKRLGPAAAPSARARRGTPSSSSGRGERVREAPSALAGSPALEPPTPRFLAVLPFRDASPPGQRSRAGEFARGLAETVSARLSRVPGVHVIPPSALPPQATFGTDVVALEHETGANLVLSGSVQRVGSQIRMGFSLVGPRRVQLGGDTLDGNMRDILALEDQLVRRIARSLELDVAALAPFGSEPPDPAAHEHYLQALGYLQRYENEASVDGAIRLLESLVKSNDRDARYHAALGKAYLAKFRLAFETDWEARAAAACRRALALDPDLPEVRMTLGALHRETGRYAEAVKDYRQALALRGDDPSVHFDLAWSHESAGEMDLAEQVLREAIALAPTFWPVHNKLGVLFFKQARYEEAARAWQHVIQLSPDNARGLYNLGAAYYHLGRYREAIDVYERSLKIRPDATAYTSLGTVYFFLGDRERAIHVFEKGKDLRPTNPRVWGNLADAYRWTPGYEDRAGPAFDRAIALMGEQLSVNRKNGRAWIQLGDWLAKRGRIAEAVSAVRKGFRLPTRDASCLGDAVRVFHLAGDDASALRWLRKAARSGCDLAELERDPELARLREDPRFERIVKERRANPPGR